MELILIRHARPHRLEVAEGPADPPLDELGVRQADALARWLAHEAVHALYTSPLARAVQTAAPIAGRLGLEATVVDDVAEWDRDAPAYIPIEELKAGGHPWWDAMANNQLDQLGIDVDGFVTRVTTAIDELARSHPGERAAVVCHGGVINAYTAAVLGLADPLFFEPDYTSVTRILVSRDGTRSVRSLNETAHLRGL